MVARGAALRSQNVEEDAQEQDDGQEQPGPAQHLEEAQVANRRRSAVSASGGGRPGQRARDGAR